MVIGSRQKLLAESHNEVNIKIEDQVISKIDHANSVGLDNRLIMLVARKSMTVERKTFLFQVSM